MSSPLYLSQRGILRLTGIDRKTFLQGLITNDIHAVSPEKTIYTLLLTPQGKFLHDFFITEQDETLFLDVQKDQIDSLKKRLDLYKLRAQVSIENVSLDYAVFATLSEEDTIPFEASKILLNYQDPRLKGLGKRWLIKGQKSGDSFFKPQDQVYDFHRLGLGIPTAPWDMIPERSIPLESGMQDLNAISWTKGCYIGQELMARTRYRGEIRKRLFPVEHLSGSFQNARDILNENNEKVGELHSFQKNWGIARLKIEAVVHSLFIDEQLLKVHQPSWMKLSF